MKLTNQEIYNTATALSLFNIEGKLPVKINFFLQKNIKTIMMAAQEIEDARMQIVQDFGDLNQETKQFVIKPENMEQVQKELNDLFNLEQDLNIHVFKLNDFENIELTYQQMSAIMFMIEE